MSKILFVLATFLSSVYAQNTTCSAIEPDDHFCGFLVRPYTLVFRVADMFSRLPSRSFTRTRQTFCEFLIVIYVIYEC